MARSPVPDFSRPFFLWWNVALRTSDMLTASSEVIEKRLENLRSDTPDQKEIALMGQEKLEAAAESFMGMGLYWFDIQRRLGAQTLKTALDIGNDALSLATARTPGAFVAHQAALGRSLVAGTAQAAKLSAEAATLTSKGLKPVHKRASANAKRLKKRS